MEDIYHHWQDWENYIYAKGDINHITKLKKLTLKDNDFIDFNTVIPIPKDIRKRYYQDRHDPVYKQYLTDHWDSPFKPYDSDTVIVADELIFVTFKTIDGAPYQWIQAVIKKVVEEKLDSLTLEFFCYNTKTLSNFQIDHSKKLGSLMTSISKQHVIDRFDL